MKSGIYQIVNIINGKSYVGSAVNLHSRWKQHKQRVEKQLHSKKLQNAFNKHGLKNFKFLILEYCNALELEIREQFWIDWLDSYQNGYNTRPKANSNAGVKYKKPGPMFGRKHSAETRKKLSESHKGLPGYWTGKRRDPELIKKMNEVRKNYTHPMKGNKHSEETKIKMRVAAKKRPSNRKGIILSKETRRKISESLKRRHAATII